MIKKIILHLIETVNYRLKGTFTWSILDIEA